MHSFLCALANLFKLLFCNYFPSEFIFQLLLLKCSLL